PPDLLYQVDGDLSQYLPVPADRSVFWRIVSDTINLPSVGGGALLIPFPGGEGRRIEAPRTLELGVAAFTTGTLQTASTDPGPPGQARLALGPGLQTVTLPLTAPATVFLRAGPPAP